MSLSDDSLTEGFPDLDEYAQALKLGFFQRCKLNTLLLATLAYKKLFSKGSIAKLKTYLMPYSKHKLEVAGRGLVDRDGFYFSNDELNEFEKNGVTKPFKVLSREDAEGLYNWSLEMHNEGKFDLSSLLGRDNIEHLERNRLKKINYTGTFQAIFHKKIRDVLCSPQVAHRIASLLGEDVILWRSQYFQKKPGDVGTFWHQNTVFRESSESDKLKPTTDVSPNMVQLTLWIALTDVTKENAAMRIIPGSFEDTRFEAIYSYSLDKKISFLSTLNNSEARKLAKVALFSTGSFYKAQALFNQSMKIIGNSFENMEKRTIEMKAGEAIIFTSANMHGSFPNNSSQDRLALVGRYTSGNTKVFNNESHNILPAAGKAMRYSLSKYRAIPIHGNPSSKLNKLL